jgi:hypothetical protein
MAYYCFGSCGNWGFFFYQLLFYIQTGSFVVFIRGGLMLASRVSVVIAISDQRY